MTLDPAPGAAPDPALKACADLAAKLLESGPETAGRSRLVVVAASVLALTAAAGLGAGVPWAAGKVASLTLNGAADNAAKSFDDIAEAVAAETERPALDPPLRISSEEQPVGSIDLRGSLAAVESPAATEAEPEKGQAFYSPETATRLADLERQAEAASRISDYGGAPPERKPAGRAAR